MSRTAWSLEGIWLGAGRAVASVGLVGLVLLGATSPVSGVDFVFTPQPPLEMLGFPWRPLAEDIDGDGLTDIVVSNGQVVSWFASDGVGGFLPEQSVDLGAPVLSLAVGDFDGNAVPDLLVGTLGGQARLYLGDGAGGFPLDETISVGGEVPVINVADLDGDGDLDFVTPRVLALPPTDQVAVYLGTGTGDFAPPTLLDVAAAPSFARPVDLDGNGTLDLLVGHLQYSPTFSGGIGFLSGDGLGGFDAEIEIISGPTTDLTVADLDFDGDSDVIAIQVAGFCGSDAVIHLRDGVGGYIPSQTISGLCGPFAAVVEDFDGDGIPDLLLPDGGDLIAATNYHEAREGVGDGTFLPPQLVGNGLFTQTAPAVADFDGDGGIDFAAAGLAGDVIVFRNLTGAGPVPFRRGDVNADAGINIADAVAILNSLFGPDLLTCPDAADVNDDAGVNIADPIALLSHLFIPGVPPPPAPFPDCGLDTTFDGLACEAPTGCP